MRRRQPTRVDLDLRERWLPADAATARAHRGAALCRQALTGQPTPEPTPAADGPLTSCPTCFAPMTGSCTRCDRKD